MSRAEQSILDYVLGDTDWFSSAPPVPAPVLTDNEGMIALLRDDFIGGAEEAATAADTFLLAVITFRNHCVEQFGG